jgi:hypothetical protein
MMTFGTTPLLIGFFVKNQPRLMLRHHPVGAVVESMLSKLDDLIHVSVQLIEMCEATNEVRYCVRWPTFFASLEMLSGWIISTLVMALLASKLSVSFASRRPDKKDPE